MILNVYIYIHGYIMSVLHLYHFMFFYLDNLHPMMTMMPWPGLDVTPVVDAFSAHPGTVFEEIDLTNPLPNWR